MIGWLLDDALTAMFGRRPLSRAIELTLEIRCAAAQLERIGDLDILVTGTCDGLMAAATPSDLNRWESADLDDVHPRRAIASEDDSAVVPITARKVPAETDEVSYRVVLDGEH